MLSGTPTSNQWTRRPSDAIASTIGKTYAATLVAEIARAAITGCTVLSAAHPSAGCTAVESPAAGARAMCDAQVVLSHLIFHLPHRCRRRGWPLRGTRTARWPPAMSQSTAAPRAMAGLIAAAQRVQIVNTAEPASAQRGRPRGSRGRGPLHGAGVTGNLPAGEAHCAPVEGTAGPSSSWNRAGMRPSRRPRRFIQRGG